MMLIAYQVKKLSEKRLFLVFQSVITSKQSRRESSKFLYVLEIYFVVNAFIVHIYLIVPYAERKKICTT